MFVYGEVLRVKTSDVCEDTGSSAGSLALMLLFLSGMFWSIFIGLVVFVYAIVYGHLCMTRVFGCICCPSLDELIGVVVGDDQPRNTVTRSYTLAKMPYDESTFKKWLGVSDCAICLNQFQDGDKVAPLHCSIKHVFHTACIQEWLKRSPVCPLCKAQIDPTEQKKFNKNAKKLVSNEVSRL